MKTALFVIDAQKAYTQPGASLFCTDSANTIERINSIIGRCETLGAVLIFIRQIHRADGSDLGRMYDYLRETEEDFGFKEGTTEVGYSDGLVIPEGAIELIKTRYSAFVGTRLAEVLREHGVQRVVVTGFMTNYCCDTTARDAHDRDFFVDFVVDATGTPGTPSLDEESIRKVVAECMDGGFARSLTTAEFLASNER